MIVKKQSSLGIILSCFVPCPNLIRSNVYISILNAQICVFYFLENRWIQQLIRFNKDEASNVGPNALNFKLPFGEIDVMEENLELIRKNLGLSMSRSWWQVIVDIDVKCEPISKMWSY
jgi:hypothetical protein